MNFYDIYVSEPRYQKQDPLTYSCPDRLNAGDVVIVPYGKYNVAGFVSREVERPLFATKQVDHKQAGYSLSSELIELHKWMLEFYPYGSGPITKLFLLDQQSLEKMTKNKLNKIDGLKERALPSLTSDQSIAVGAINGSEKNSFLLHGETGSGKTRIYQELAQQTLAQDKSVIILVPEISLINQIRDSFADIGQPVSLIHSNLTKKQHRENWQNLIQSTRPSILIGTRSAIFAPIYNLGSIVIDEMHETSYKQDSIPRYNALRVAAKRSAINHAKIIYGSATPSISEYFLAKKLDIPILRITEKAKQTSKIKKTIIDIKDRENFSTSQYISEQLIKAVELRMKKGEQSMLFLNRRGTAKQIVCQNCGWQALCPRCDLPMTLHADVHQIRCHTCGYTEKPIYSCPDCKNSDITYRSIGTKAIVDALESIFTEANIKRFDTDNLTADKLSNHYSDVRSGKIDIIVGTQMLGKGLDLPRLSLVGIINADTSLSMPDFSSVEKNYQLIHQAIGRVGRGHIDGEVILQTLYPDNRIIKAALEHNWQLLYDQEIAEREKFNFPPFKFMAKISASRKNSSSSEKYLASLRQKVLSINSNLDISQPMPSFYEKISGNYNWHIIIKASNRNNLVEVIKQLPAGNHNIDLDPLNLL